MQNFSADRERLYLPGCLNSWYYVYIHIHFTSLLLTGICQRISTLRQQLLNLLYEYSLGFHTQHPQYLQLHVFILWLCFPALPTCTRNGRYHNPVTICALIGRSILSLPLHNLLQVPTQITAFTASRAFHPNHKSTSGDPSDALVPSHRWEKPPKFTCSSDVPIRSTSKTPSHWPV